MRPLVGHEQVPQLEAARSGRRILPGGAEQLRAQWQKCRRLPLPDVVRRRATAAVAAVAAAAVAAVAVAAAAAAAAAAWALASLGDNL